MTQFLDFKDDNFTFYYTRPHISGTDQFEHKVSINLSELKYLPKRDVLLNPVGDDEDYLVVECPCGCGTSVTVPLAGDSEAQELHARHRARKNKQTIEQAREHVRQDIRNKGHLPRV